MRLATAVLLICPAVCQADATTIIEDAFEVIALQRIHETWAIELVDDVLASNLPPSQLDPIATQLAAAMAESAQVGADIISFLQPALLMVAYYQQTGNAVGEALALATVQLLTGSLSAQQASVHAEFQSVEDAL